MSCNYEDEARKSRRYAKLAKLAAYACAGLGLLNVALAIVGALNDRPLWWVNVVAALVIAASADSLFNSAKEFLDIAAGWDDLADRSKRLWS